MGRRHRRLPGGGRRRRGRPQTLHLGHLQSHPGQGRRRRHRGRGLRPLPPLARGPRPAGRTGPGRLPVLHRLAPRPAGRRRHRQRAGPGLLRPAHRRPAGGGHHALPHALPLGSAPGAPGPGRLAGPGDRRAVRRVHGRRRRPARRPHPALVHPQRAAVLGLDRPLRRPDGARPHRHRRRRAGLLPPPPGTRTRRPGAARGGPRRAGGHRQQPHPLRTRHRQRGGRRGRTARRRARQPLVDGPAARPRLPAGHGRAVRDRAAAAPRRRGDRRRAAGLARTQILLPQRAPRRPRGSLPPRPVRRTARRGPGDRHGLGGARRGTHEHPAPDGGRLRGTLPLRHRERRRLSGHRRPRRTGPRPRAHPLPGRAPDRMRPRRTPRGAAAGVLRLVAAGQLRMGLRVRAALRPRPRRLRHPAADRQDQRPPLRRPRPHPPRPPGTAPHSPLPRRPPEPPEGDCRHSGAGNPSPSWGGPTHRHLREVICGSARRALPVCSPRWC